LCSSSLLLLAPVWAQNDVRELMGLAQSAAPEIAADAMLRMVQAGDVPRADAPEVLRRAFAVASRAQFHVRRYPVRNTDPESRENQLGLTQRAGLDRVSLQARAVELLLNLRHPAARELFAQIAKPANTPLGCRDVLVPSFDDYYETAGRVLREAYSPREVEQDAPFQQFVAWVGTAESPLELAPLTRVALSMPLDGSQTGVAVAALAAAMTRSHTDDRAFTASLPALTDEWRSLYRRAADLQVSTVAMGEAFRGYLLRNYRATRCAESPALNAEMANTALKFYNETLRGEAAELKGSELRTETIADPAKLAALWQSAPARQAFGAAQRLRFAANGMPYSLADRRTPEWKRQLDELLGQLASWQHGDGESEVDAFLEKSLVLEALVELTPPGEERAKLIRAFVVHLRNSGLEQSQPAVWYWHARELHLRLYRNGDADAVRLLEAYAASGNVSLGVYARLASRYPERASPF
jgi:hypothetical protein